MFKKEHNKYFGFSILKIFTKFDVSFYHTKQPTKSI